MLQVVEPNAVKALSLDPIKESTLQDAQTILDDVEKDGEQGLLKHAVRLGDLESLESKFIFSREDMKKAFDSLSDKDRGVLERTANRVRAFATVQKGSIVEVECSVPGGRAGQSLAAVETAACYAPGGRYPLPSSVIMTAITARVAGVKNVWIASPRPQPATLAAGFVAGADALLGVGGPHAIGAFAYGIEGKIPKSDVICGPGNAWVTAAKKLVYGRVSIDMLAGPSECLVIADESANPATIAADLIAQAEHDTDALPILVTTDPSLPEKVNNELFKQLETLSTKAVAEVACKKGFSVLCDSLEQAISISDTIGPEHLEIMTKNSDADAKLVSNYGGLFIGGRSAEVFGDYGAGPNHVLPTSGSARYTGGLSVFTFLRIRTWLRLDDDDSEQQKQLIEDSVHLARMEGLEGHARAAEQRL